MPKRARTPAKGSSRKRGRSTPARRTLIPVRRTKKSAMKSGLTKTQKQALKNLMGENIAVKDVFRDNAQLYQNFTLIPAVVGQNAMYSLSNVSTVAANRAQPAEREGDSIKAMNIDIRGRVTFTSSCKQTVRFILVQWDEVPTSNANGIQQIFPNTYSNDQPFLVIDSFRVRKPEAKYKILTDVTVSYTPQRVGGLGEAVDKPVRIYHKFKESEASMNYTPGIGTGTGPQTNCVQLFSVYAEARKADGTEFINVAPPLWSHQIRMRYMK